MKKSVLITLCTIILSACSARAVLVTKKVDYDPQSEARIRVYNNNGNATTKVLSDTSCQDIEDKKKKGISRNPFSKDNMHNGLPKRTLKNISIGMPLTTSSVQALQRDSFTDTLSFTEQLITAGKPTFIRGSQFDIYSCDIRGEFTPEAGKDYEISYGTIEVPESKTGLGCVLFINELVPITSDDPKVTAKLGKEISYKKCN